MKYPYGISDFKKINTKNYFYCNRTDKIPLLEKSDFQLFIRPRLFGKSLVLSMLESYYDVAKKDEFEEIFGELKIGKNLTDLRNSYFILKFGFSCVDPTESAEDVKIILKVPNLVMQSLYAERVQKMLLPEPDDRNDGKDAAKKLHQKCRLLLLWF